MRTISPSRFVLASLLLGLLAQGAFLAADPTPPPDWSRRHDELVLRLRGLAGKEGAFGPAYRPLYHAAIGWYELWGGRDPAPVDADMVSPEDYASELAGALENGRNFFAENPGALFPLVFEKTLPGGKVARANYWLRQPAGFPSAGRLFPLVVDLHGSGWLGHKLSFKRSTRPPDETFSVTPINMGGPWQIDFLNAYLDELIAVLPVDTDRIYVEGHSLGAMATWEWALDNPERFAAISPRAGVGEPYRAARLKYVPSWVIHGGDDDVIPSGFAEQMVAALQAQGVATRLSIIKGGPHNMPADLDQQQVVDWFLRQTRSHMPPPSDPRDSLGLNASGYSPWEIITVPKRASWRSRTRDLSHPNDYRAAAGSLFAKAHAGGDAVDSPLVEEMDLKTRESTLWLAVPTTLHGASAADSTVSTAPGGRMVRFYYRGTIPDALKHLQSIRAEVESSGHTVSGAAWITTLSIWRNSPDAIAEYRAPVD